MQRSSSRRSSRLFGRRRTHSGVRCPGRRLHARIAWPRSSATGVTAVELPLAWDRYEPAPGEVDAAYVAEVREKIATCRDAGMRIVLGPGLQYPPVWVQALPGAVMRGSAGNTPAQGGLDLVFDAEVREAASAYLGRLATICR